MDVTNNESLEEIKDIIKRELKIWEGGLNLCVEGCWGEGYFMGGSEALKMILKKIDNLRNE